MRNKKMKQCLLGAAAALLAGTALLGTASTFAEDFAEKYADELEALATAISVRVLETDGTVEVTNQCGVTLPVFVNMKLQTGYEVTTEEASYAWMVLDDMKLAELDAVSDMKVQRKGEELALMLDAGNMFFDVTEKLSDEESMNIRTSTMVMGIRGTAGLVRVCDSMHSQAALLDGEVDARLTNPLTGETDEVHLTAGDIADFYIYDKDATPSCEIIVQRFLPEAVDGFALMYLKDHPDTVTRIQQSSGLDLTEVLATAEDRLKKDQEAVHEKIAAAQAAYDALEEPEIIYDPVFKDGEPAAPGEVVPTPTAKPGATPVPGATTAPTPTLKPGTTATPTTKPAASATPTTKPAATATPTTKPAATATPTPGLTPIDTPTPTPHTHKYGAYRPNGDATCVSLGTMTASCSICGEKDTVTDPTTKGAHSYSYKEISAATCEMAALEEGICDYCGDITRRESPDGPHGHSFGAYDIPEGGICGMNMEAQCIYGCGAVDANGPIITHEWYDYDVVEDATCEDNAVHIFECSICGNSETREMPGTATGHSWSFGWYGDMGEVDICENGCGAERTHLEDGTYDIWKP